MAWMLSGAIVALLGIIGSLLYQMYGIPVIFSDFYRAEGTYGDSNMYAGHMLMNFFLAFVYFRLGGKRWVFISLPLIYLVGLFMSSSKGGMFAFLVALTAFATIVPQYRVRSFAIIGTILLVFSGTSLISGNLLNFERLSQITDTEDYSTQSRLALWRASYEVWNDNLLFGVGRGLFGKVSGAQEKLVQQIQNDTRRRHVKEVLRESGDYVVSHNTYLSFLCETGIIGFLLFIAIMATFFHRVVRSLVSLDSSSNSYIVMACLGAALTGIFVQGMSINIENFRSLWCLAGLIFAISNWTTYNKTVFKA
jgi:O-antigen ligase